MKIVIRFFAKILPLLNFIFLFPAVAHAQWSAPAVISSGAVSASLNESMGPCIGVSGDTLHVVWCDKKNNTKAVIYYTQSLDTGLTWSTPIAISDTSRNSWNPAIAVNGSNVHVVWRDVSTINGHRASWYKHSLDGGITWGSGVFLDSTADWPAVSVSGTKVYVANDVVTSQSPYNTEIFFLRSLDNGLTWSSPQQLTFSVGRSEDEAIMAQGSYVHMSWNDNRNGYMQIFYKQSADYGVTWGADTLINSEHSYGTMVCVDSTNIDIPSAGAPSGHYQIHLNQSGDNGLTWGVDKNLTNDTAHTYFYPYMVRDDSDLHVVCGGSAGAKYLHSGDGGLTWDSAYTYTGGSSFIAYTGCALHIIFADAAHKINYMRNPNGNAGYCGGVIIGLNETQKSNHVNIFPNPFINETTLKISSSEKITNAELKIFDIFGNELRTVSEINSSEINIERGTLSSGIYFYQVKNNGINVATGKLILQ